MAAVKAAGLYCVGVLGTVEPARLGFADVVVARLDVEAVRALPA